MGRPEIQDRRQWKMGSQMLGCHSTAAFKTSTAPRILYTYLTRFLGLRRNRWPASGRERWAPSMPSLPVGPAAGQGGSGSLTWTSRPAWSQGPLGSWTARSPCGGQRRSLHLPFTGPASVPAQGTRWGGLGRRGAACGPGHVAGAAPAWCRPVRRPRRLATVGPRPGVGAIGGSQVGADHCGPWPTTSVRWTHPPCTCQAVVPGAGVGQGGAGETQRPGVGSWAPGADVWAGTRQPSTIYT